LVIVLISSKVHYNFLGKEKQMATKQGDVTLLNDPIAIELLQSRIPARLAYVGSDGTPRVVPIWFHWNGTAIVLGTPLMAPKTKALMQNPRVALTIDTDDWPHKVLQIRGTAQIETIDGVAPEYEAAAQRYFGKDQGQTWIEQVMKMFPRMARISISPEWVSIIDFERRFPSAIEAAMSR
jgi:PPOX class probable F420-dependent enzyme